MPEYLCEQRSDEWRRLRLGTLTMSRAADMITQPKFAAERLRKKLSATAQSYVLGLVAEYLTGEEQGPAINAAMQHGIDNEPAARELYSLVTGNTVREVGFVTLDDEPRIGCSPDGLVGDDGGIEIKCPYHTRVHLGYVLSDEVPREYLPQIQGAMWVTGRQWWDFVSYDPRIRGDGSLPVALWIKRVKRDDAYIERLATAVYRVRDAYLEALCIIKETMR